MDLADLTDWTLEQITADERDQQRRADCTMKRDLVEWALGVEALRTLRDPAAPARPLGEDVLRILASGYAGRPGYDDAWRP